jgi:tRNA-splicing ligase RtcB
MPSAVGVDIGCGMVAARTNLMRADLGNSLAHIREAIEQKIPHGRTNEGQRGDRGAWDEVPEDVQAAWFGFDGTGYSEDRNLVRGYDEICAAAPKLFKPFNNVKQLGTLGTGNHFIEVCVDTEDCVWVILHSGSRGIGASIGNYYMKKAQEYCTKNFITLPNKDLAYLVESTPLFDEYIHAVQWAQTFAWESRLLMLKRALSTILLTSEQTSEIIAHCHHNFVRKEYHFGQSVWVTRKGAVNASKGVMGIIPGSMGTRSFIVAGKGNPESYESCSHGAGRVMSRGAAFKTFTIADHEKATEGVECRKDSQVLDETPGAYKSIDAVMAAQSDLIEIRHELKQLICVKG